MAKNYKGKFDYTTACGNYECVVKGGIPWWVWILSGLLLLLIASFYVRWDRQLTVQVVDELNRPVEKAEVAVNYTARFCPWLKKDIALRGTTDKRGEVVIDDMPVSVWSYLFYHNEPVEVKGAKGNAEACDTVPLHTKDRVVLHLRFPKAKMSISIRTIDAFTGEPLSGSKLFVTVDDDGMRSTPYVTGADGTAVIPDLYSSSIISVIAKNDPNYVPNDTTVSNAAAIDLLGNTTDISLSPVVRCNQQVAHTTFQPHTVIDNIDMGVNSGMVMFRYYTDAYPDHIKVFDANGKLLFDAGNIATNYSTLTKQIQFSTRTLRVEVNTYDNDNTGSNWNFTFDCP